MIHRLLPIAVLTAMPAVAQLPPSALRPQQPAPAAPAAPTAPPTAAPATPFGTVAPEPATTVPDLDLSNTIPNTLTPEEVAQGWKLLFDGQRLTGLRGLQRNDPISSGWKIEAGELNLPKDIRDMDRTTGGDLITTESFWDFDFRFEWKAMVSSNGGIRYMLSLNGTQHPIGLEYQIIDDVHNPTGLKGGLLRRSGALDNILPVGENARLRTADPLNRKGDPWNEGRIIVRGSRVEHYLNGEKVLAFDLGPQLRTLAERNAERGTPRPGPMFGMKSKTQICILDEGTEIAYRNLKIRPLAPVAVAAPGGVRPVTPAVPAVPGTGAGARTTVPDPFLIKPKR